MAKNTIADLDTTTSNNQDVLGQSTLGSADANALDQVDRATLALLARFYADLGGVATVGGSANAITVTSASTYQALESGLVLSFKAGSANTGATTLNLDGLGAKAVRRKGDSALSAGDIAANGRYLVVYDAAYNSAAGAWVLMNPEPTAIASSANFLANTADKVLDTDGVWGAAAEVTLTDAATIAVDMSTFLNATVTLGGNRTLGQPSNVKVGQSGMIRVVQDATGSRTLAYHADWEFAGGSAPVLSTAANSQDLLFYQVLAANRIFASLVKGVV